MANPQPVPDFVPAASQDEFRNMVSGLLQAMVLADSDDARDKAIAEMWKKSGGTTTDTRSSATS